MDSDDDSDSPVGEELKNPQGKLDNADYEEFVATLGLSPDRDSDLLWIAEYAFSAPLPPNWSEHVDEELRIYFYNSVTVQSSWSHPLDDVFREIVRIALAWRGEHSAAERARLEEQHLHEAQQRAMQHLEGWSGPYTTTVPTEDGREETFEYFYNSRTQTTTWDNPVAEHEYTLSTRYWILHRVLFPEEDLEPMPPVGEASSPLLKLPLHLLKQEPDVEPPPLTPGSGTARTFYTARESARDSARESARDIARGRVGASSYQPL
jgi:hypothetical protein